MKCKYCNSINDDDAVFCKKCGNSLLEEDIKKTKDKSRQKKKVKVKKKVKKVKQRKVKNKNKSDKKMSFGNKLLFIIMLLIILILLSACLIGGYYYYNQQNIEVPNVVGLTYTDAESELAKADLKAVKVEKEVEDTNQEGIVIKQNKNGKKVAKNSKIKLTIGIIKKYTLPNFIGKNIDQAKNELTHNNIKYKIEYMESEKENGIILEQSPKLKKIDSSIVVTLYVSKKQEKDISKDNIKEEEEEETKEEVEEDKDNIVDNE